MGTARGWKNFEAPGRKILACLEETINGNMDVKGVSTEFSYGNKESVIKAGGKVIFVIK